MHGPGASLRQMLRFARPWERVVLGLVIVAVATPLGSYFLAALGLVIVGVTVLGMVRTRRGGAGVSEVKAESESESASGTSAGVGDQP